MIKRTKYLQKIIPFIDKPLIKVIIGVRRSGKTVLLSQVREHIQAAGINNERIVDINFESFANRKYQTADALYEHVLQKSKAVSGKRLYLFFDEIQEVSDWQKVINSFSVDIDCDIYITGSNSNLLSGELATYIAGRYVHFTVYPFTFSEYLELKGGAGVTFPMSFPRVFTTEETYFDDYLRFGGLPQRFLLEDEQSIRVYLDDVFNTIVVKDIIARNKISDVDLLRRLTAFLLENVGNPFSANAICNKLKSEGVKTTVATLMNYISAIKNAMVVLTAPRYDLKGKALLSTNEKYYATDLGLRNNVKSSDLVDYNKLYENIIFIEMLSRGYEIHVGKIGDYEVDFICLKGREKIYIQVAYLLADRSVIEREFRPLLKIEDNFPKYVVSSDKHDFSNNGIIHKNIIEFLLSPAF
ncbi:MAG: AAA family ATPase [Bacillota bacterium]|uniref:ATP-binding protein n=1 Tax=Candidatus Gallimonas intestinavium TaxID=2838603 RepID=A0A9D2K1D1_9FIRM|nr:MAG: AAA family ATPase [Bacillota bacterium]HIZ73524.1 ATP-binding protein [Candidatus Gallimonas intestinavium]